MIYPACPFSQEEIDALIENMLKNISTSSNCLTMSTKDKILMAKSGTIIASPSMPDNRFSQSYFFHWVRDGAITMSSVCQLYENSKDSEKKAYYKEIILNYLDFVEVIQSQPMLNGVDVLGEPKFNVDGTVWTEPWGRPQVGGAACQALVLSKILNLFLQEEGHEAEIKRIYNHSSSSLLKANLEYCAKIWESPSFNMWEELNGKHFSVCLLQHVALLVGSLVAVRFLDPKAALYYKNMANHILSIIRSHWNENLGYYFETLNAEHMLGGGLDASAIIALLPIQKCPILEDEFRLTSYKTLSTLFYIRNAFEKLYRINVENALQGKKGVLIGRYPQDIYDGNQSLYGNPWFLCSAVLANAYYSLANQILSGHSILVTNLVLPFLFQITGKKWVLKEKIDKHHASFSFLIESLLSEGDAILALLKEYAVSYEDGSIMHMSEQIDRSSGEQVSAQDLTWSYSATLTALDARHALIEALSKI